MPAPEVSAIIPLYNKRATIRRAIASALAQRGVTAEIIVVDDGSTDDSATLVEALADTRPDRLVRLVRQENGGPGRARNAGAALARAPLLAFLDADDEWRPGYLAKGLAAMGAHPACVAYACGYDSGDFRDDRPNKVRELGKGEGPCALATDHDGAAIKMHVDALHSSAAIVRQAVFERLGGFYDARRCLYGEDSYLWLQILLAGPIYWDPGELVRFHVEDSALGHAVRRRRRARPISTDAATLREGCPPAYRPSLERAIRAFVDMDLAILASSGAAGEARRLRRLHGLDRPLSRVRDRLRHLRALIGGGLGRS